MPEMIDETAILAVLWTGGALAVGAALKSRTPISNDTIPWVLAIIGGLVGWGLTLIPGATQVGFYMGAALAMAASPIQKGAQKMTQGVQAHAAAKLIPLLVAGSLLVPPTTARAEEGLGDHAVYVGVTPLGFAVGSDELDGEYLATGSGFYVFPWGVVLEYEGGWADGEEVHYGRVGYAVVDRAPWHLQAFVGTRGIDEATLQGAVAAVYDFAPSRHLRLLVDVDQDGAVAPRLGYFWSRD